MKFHPYIPAKKDLRVTGNAVNPLLPQKGASPSPFSAPKQKIFLNFPFLSLKTHFLVRLL